MTVYQRWKYKFKLEKILCSKTKQNKKTNSCFYMATEILHKDNVIILGLTADFPCCQSFKFPIAPSLTPISFSQVEEATAMSTQLPEGNFGRFFPSKVLGKLSPFGWRKIKICGLCMCGQLPAWRSENYFELTGKFLIHVLTSGVDTSVVQEAGWTDSTFPGLTGNWSEKTHWL